MLVLFETAAGCAIFKVLDEKKLKNIDNICEEFSTASQANDFIKLVKFKRFDTPLVARDYYLQQKEGNLAKLLKKVLKKQISEGEELAVGDTKLGNIIKEKLNIPCVSNAATTELMRGIRSHIDSLLDEHKDELANMRLALAHSLGRYQVKFNPDKIDTMIIQGISLLDDLDKELNNYIMRCREWYGWHFPELSKIISDPILYVKTVRAIGIKQNAINIDMSEFLSPDLEAKIKSEAEISMGTMISDSDMNCIQYLCEQILDLSDYRAQLSQYLKERMATLAPNLTALLGELVGARLISHAGSLVTLAKYPASTVQILGAEKALFRALKTKKDTPKYGLIYHAQIVGQASTKMKGKMARKLSAKVSLASRIDALADESKGASMGIEARAYLERVSRQGQEPRRISGVSTKHDKYRFKSENFEYDASVDSTVKKAVSKKFADDDDDDDVDDMKETIKEEPDVEDVESQSKKKHKKKKHAEMHQEIEISSPTKDRKRKLNEDEGGQSASGGEENVEAPRKKHKKHKDISQEKQNEEAHEDETEKDTSHSESFRKKKKKAKKNIE